MAVITMIGGYYVLSSLLGDWRASCLATITSRNPAFELSLDPRAACLQYSIPARICLLSLDLGIAMVLISETVT